jgi:hypothetical protein
MAKTVETVYSDEQLKGKLKEILQDWPLYREYQYLGSPSHYLPEEISHFCDNPKCQKDQLWKKSRSVGGHDKHGWNTETYTCKNCDENAIRFYYYWGGSQENSGVFLKAGQFPPLQKEPPLRLGKKLNDTDRALYRKALTSRNNSYGLGSLAYLRRIVENRMNDLLDLLHEAAKQEESAEEELKKIEQVKSSWRFDDKITYAAKLLPKRLMPGGINPIDKLHDLASEGIHHRGEDECLEIFDRCKASFEYVFRELDVQIEDAKAYIASLAAPRK